MKSKGLLLGLVLLLMAGVLRADIAENRNKVEDRRVEVQSVRAVRAIEMLGGSVFRLEQVPGKPVWMVNLTDTKVTDADLKDLATLEHLEGLILFRTQVTDAGLNEMAGLRQLHLLDVQRTKVSDEGTNKLQEALPRCQILH